jgi:hypothetical protein
MLFHHFLAFYIKQYLGGGGRPKARGDYEPLYYITLWCE